MVNIGRRLHVVRKCLVWAFLIVLASMVPLAQAQPSQESLNLTEQDLSIDLKLNPSTFTLGDIVTVTLTVRNLSESDANIWLRSGLPPGFKIPLEMLPIGSSYNLRSGVFQWEGAINQGATMVIEMEAQASNIETSGPIVVQSQVGYIGYSTPTDRFAYLAVSALDQTAELDHNSETVIEEIPAYSINPSAQVEQGWPWWWYFGDGSVNVSDDAARTTDVYDSEPERFPVELDQDPFVEVLVDVDQLEFSRLVTFSALTDIYEPSFIWDFGDGELARHQSVMHSFDSVGEFDIILMAYNSQDIVSDTLSITVTPDQVYLTPQVQETFIETTFVVQDPISSTIVQKPLDPLAQQMLDGINYERLLAGLAPLSWSDDLARSSQHHTDDMAYNAFTGHYGSDASRPIERMRQASYEGDYAGECTAWGFDDFASALTWWMNSPPHRAIILHPLATTMGGAHTFDTLAPHLYYWTIDFGVD
ncbi:MAG: CAP domain-containing protein [Chloroflexota bacterium]